MLCDACGCTYEAIVGLSDLQLLSVHLSCVELFPESLPKGADKSSIFVKNNGRQEDIMFPHMFKEDLSSPLCCHSLLAWYEYNHLGKYVYYY